MLVVGKCWKKDGWVVSVYQRMGDTYITMKVKKVKKSDQMRSKSKIQAEKHASDSNAEEKCMPEAFRWERRKFHDQGKTKGSDYLGV